MTYDFDSFALAQNRFIKTEERAARDSGFGSTKDAMAIIQKHIDSAVEIVETKLADTKRSSAKDFLPDLSLVAPEVIALVALQGALDNIGAENGLNATFHNLGSMMEREVNAASMLAHDAKTAKAVMTRAKRKGANVKYRRQAVNAAMKAEGYATRKWDKTTKGRVGMWLVEVLSDMPDVFFIVRTTEGSEGPQSYITLTEDALSYSQEMVKALIEARPVALPTLTMPPAWTSHKLTLESNGKPYSVPLIRKGGLNKVFIKKAIADGTMQPVLDALTRASQVAWSIDSRILEVAKMAYDFGIELDSMPTKADITLPEKLSDDVWEAMTDDERRVRRMEIGEALGKNRSLVGERSIWDADMAAAEYLTEHGNRFYTVMNLDYRGRVYGIPYFNFQRQDYVRGMFRYYEGVTLGTEGLYWLKVHLANCGDFGKVSKAQFSDRIKWVDDNHQRLVEMAESPLDDLWWTEADAPFCFLAAAMEYADGHASPETFTSHLPVSFDGTCSGLQHLAAMTRCDDTAPLVNLTNNLLPADVYRTVAERLADFLQPMTSQDDEDGEIARLALAYGVDRSLVKRNVMTYTYGSKKFGMIDQLKTDTMRPLQVKVIRKRLDVHPFQVAGDTYTTDKGDVVTNPGNKAARLLGSAIFDTIESVVQRPAEAMRFLQKVSKALSHEGKPTVWTTPLGFPVVLHHPNQKTELLRLWMYDRGVRVKARLAVNEDLGGINKEKTANAVAPCFVHSYDATHLMMVVNHAYSYGITNTALVHDSFGCHAAHAGRFRGMITETFRKLYSENDVLGNFLAEAHAQIHTNSDRLPARSDVSTGSYNLDEIMEASYAFA